MAHMDRLMEETTDDSLFARDRDMLDEFFLLSKLGAFPSARHVHHHPHQHHHHHHQQTTATPHARQRLVRGRPVSDEEERQRRTGKAQSCFREAVRQGDARKVATLLSRQVVERNTLDAPYTYGGVETSPMIDACRGGHLDVVRQLIEHCGPQIVNRRVGHQTPLYVAAKHGHSRVVELLLEHGAETEPRLGSRRNSAVAELPGGSVVRDTPLHAAIRYIHSLSSLCDVDVRLQLMLERSNNNRQHHLDVIDALLGGGASFLSPDYAGDTPMELLHRWMQEM
jgi:hypothetical protein